MVKKQFSKPIGLSKALFFLISAEEKQEKSGGSGDRQFAEQLDLQLVI
jgi:hypothetical protein